MSKSIKKGDDEELKNLIDNILIDGLIKEAEQENAEFEAAMRRMSEYEFYEMISDNSEEAKKDLKSFIYKKKLRLSSSSSDFMRMSKLRNEKLEFAEASFAENAAPPLPRPAQQMMSAEPLYSGPQPKLRKHSRVSRKSVWPWIISIVVAAAVGAAISAAIILAFVK